MTAKSIPAIERFMLLFTEAPSPVGFNSPCWRWRTPSPYTGYGHFRDEDGRTKLAHRWSYVHFVGPIGHADDGRRLVIDHLCRNEACVNPDHLEAVTDLVNSLRGASPTFVAHLRDQCLKGHPFTEENTKWQRKGDRLQRACWTCIRARRRRWEAARFDAARERSL